MVGETRREIVDWTTIKREKLQEKRTKRHIIREDQKEESKTGEEV